MWPLPPENLKKYNYPLMSFSLPIEMRRDKESIEWSNAYIQWWIDWFIKKGLKF